MALTQKEFLKQFSATRIILPVLLGIGVIIYMLWDNFETSHLQILLHASPFWLAITLLVLAVRDLGYMYRIRFLTDKMLSWKQSFRVIMLWEFATSALPSVVGSSTIAAFILYKEKIPLGKSIAQVMVTAMLDNLYFVVTLPLVLLFTGSMVLPELTTWNPALRQSIGIAFFISYLLITLYACTMFYALFINPKGVKKLLVGVGKLKPLKRWRTSLYTHANELLVASKLMRSKDASFWLHASISTIFVWTARYLVIGCLIAAFAKLGAHEHLIIFARNLVYKIALFLSVSPGGAGFAEVSFPVFFGAFLGSFTTVAILLYRLLTYYVYLLIGVIIFPKWAAKVFKKKQSSVNVTADPILMQPASQ